ncbi:DUF6233 domain-containing protein [Streptomyces chattanoogensis]|uniref:DUF6233 domain-containing protein n=1 Tax=Streptomyces chattanoogensis TaxID=66876 RepID=UPI0036C390B9
MSDSLPWDLQRLKTLEQYLVIQLRAVHSRLAEVERREAERPTPIPRPRPDWVLQPARAAGDRRPLYVHQGDCEAATGRPITRAQAIEALTTGVEPCAYCRPDTLLGL